MQDKWGHTNLAAVEKTLKSFKPTVLATAYAEAVLLVIDMRKSDVKTHRVPAMYFKNSASQKKLNTILAVTQ